MTLITAFYIAIYVTVIGLTWLVVAFRPNPIRPNLKDKQPWLLLGKAALPAVIASPILIYDAYVFTTDPILKVWSQQNLILSPPSSTIFLLMGC